MSRCLATSLAGDHVGAGGCINLGTSEEFEWCVHECEMRRQRRHKDGRGLESVGKSKEPKELPPSLPLPRPRPRLPWIMKRYRTCDGRLIIQREKVGHCEYRRLMLHLVSLDDDAESDVNEDYEEEGCSVVPDGESSSENVDGGVFSGERASSSGCGCLMSPIASLNGVSLTCK